MSSINPVTGQEKEEKTIVKPLAVKNGDQVKTSKTEQARNEGSIWDKVL